MAQKIWTLPEGSVYIMTCLSAINTRFVGGINALIFPSL